MHRLRRRREAGLNFVILITFALIGCAMAAAQANTTLTPAQQRAQAAKEARQEKAQQAAANRATAAQARAAAAQNRALPNKSATNSTPPKSAATPMTNTANPAGSAATPSNVPGSAKTPAGAQETAGAGAVGSGTLAWQTRVYTSSGCVHNGNSAVCTFTFSNQGNDATLVAGSELSGVQLVDDAHVPHRANGAHFVDKYGTQQTRLLVQPGDTGTYVVTFPDVNSQVSTGDFHLRQQIVGGVTFSGSKSATTGTATNTSPRAGGTAPK